jgi:hypothetical protein
MEITMCGEDYYDVLGRGLVRSSLDEENIYERGSA